MNQFVPLSAAALPAIVAAGDERAKLRFLEFFAVQIRNPNTRRAYLGDVEGFLTWCAGYRVHQLGEISPLHVASYIELLTRSRTAPTTKRCLAALRKLFDWLVTGQVVPSNPATSVRGPKYSQRQGKTPILAADEARALLDSIDASTLVGLRDRAFIATMLLTFARVSAVAGMKVEDLYLSERRYWARLHEKGGKLHEMPCNHKLETYLVEWLEVSGLKDEPKAPLFPTIRRGTGNGAGELTRTHLQQQNAYDAVRRHAAAAGMPNGIGNHSMRGTGLTSFLKNGGSLRKAQEMANHADLRTTQLYDRRKNAVTIEDVERTMI
ncbi:MAG: tyrosine-type recombinase/integrase [Allorhizobium sp.]|nr:MAG: integrase [Bosea sp. 12-68-7]